MLFILLAITVQNFVLLQVSIRKLWDFKHLKMGQILHVNIEGFRWPSPLYRNLYSLSQTHCYS